MISLIKYVFITLNSNFRLGVKVEIIRVLLTLYLKSKIIHGKKEIKQVMMGFTVSAFDYEALLYLFKEIFLRQEYYFKSEKPNPSILDCGANIGMSVLYFKYLYPDCEIIAFEPNPYAFALLEKNIAQNGLNHVEIRNSGLSNAEGYIDFFVEENKGSLTGSILKARGGKRTLRIHSEKLSKYIQDTQFDLTKMDIEGAESEVLSDLVSANRIGHSNQYIIEYHHRIRSLRSSMSDFIRPFEEAGFEYNLRTSFTKCGDFQDILLNFYKENRAPTGQQVIEDRLSMTAS